MDLTAICLCKDHDMPLVVFDMHTKGALTAIINGDKVGTRIVAGCQAAAPEDWRLPAGLAGADSDLPDVNHGLEHTNAATDRND